MSIHHPPKCFQILVVFVCTKGLKHGRNQCLVNTKINRI
jgi:hypothetical protein